MALMGDKLSPSEAPLWIGGGDVVDAPAPDMLPYGNSLTMRDLPIVYRPQG
jgi:hypothetical protein